MLALPAGFSYVTFSHSGSIMSDGYPTPLALDGMGAFAGRARQGPASCGSCATARTATPPARRAASSATAARPTTRRAFGGTTTLVYDERRRDLVEDFVSLNGTSTNCAGGISYRRKYWLTGEETVGGPDYADAAARFAKRHGYLFQTPVDRGPDELEPGVPITAAGRFCHEAAAVDQRRASSTRPRTRARASAPASTATRPTTRTTSTAGGKLDMLAITGQPNVDLREGRTRGEALPVTLGADRRPGPRRQRASRTPHSTFNQGWAQGGAKFNRLEGCWEDDGTIFFVSTSGGDAKNGDVNSDGYAEGFGQVWAYVPPRLRTLTLIYESRRHAARTPTRPTT